MKKSFGFIFAVMGVLSTGVAVAPFADARTITVSSFSTHQRTEAVLYAAEIQVAKDKNGTITADCGNDRISIPSGLNFPEINRYLVQNCKNGLIAEITNQQGFTDKALIRLAGEYAPSIVIVSGFSTPDKIVSVVGRMEKVVMGKNRAGKVIVALGVHEKSDDKSDSAVKTVQ